MDEPSIPETQPDDPRSPAEALSGEPAAESSGPAADAAPKSLPGGRRGSQTRKGRRRGSGRPKRSPQAAPEAEAVAPPSPEDLERVTSEKVRQALELGHPVEGTVIGWNQGGFHVVVDGMTAFCPRSLMEIGDPHEPAAYMDRSFVFRILRLEDRGHRLILSRAAMLREERRQKTEALRRSLQVGQVVSCEVVALADFGAFVDLGGIEGLIHISELSHGRPAHPSDVVRAGDRLEAKIVKLPGKNERVSLSLKALLPDPWTGISERLAPGQKVRGKVLRTTEFGAFVELEPGVEGLLHRTQFSSSGRKAAAPPDPGTELELFVREVDVDKRRISLSLQEVPKEDPWSRLQERYAEGSVHEGVVERIEKKGVLIQLEPGLSGLLPGSETGLPREAKLARVYPVGKKVKVQIASIDTRRRRLSLTLEGKALEGSKSDYREYQKAAKKSSGLGAMAAALAHLRRS